MGKTKLVFVTLLLIGSSLVIAKEPKEMDWWELYKYCQELTTEKEAVEKAFEDYKSFMEHANKDSIEMQKMKKWFKTRGVNTVDQLQNKISEDIAALNQKNQDQILALNQKDKAMVAQSSSSERQIRNLEGRIAEQNSIKTKFVLDQQEKNAVLAEDLEKANNQLAALRSIIRDQINLPMSLTEFVDIMQKSSPDIPFYKIGSSDDILNGRPLIKHVYKPDASQDLPQIAFWTDKNNSDKVIGVTALWRQTTQKADTTAKKSAQSINLACFQVAQSLIRKAAHCDFVYPITGFEATEEKNTFALHSIIGTWDIKSVIQNCDNVDIWDTKTVMQNRDDVIMGISATNW